MTARKNSVSLNGRPLRRRRRAVLERYMVTSCVSTEAAIDAKSHADAARRWVLAWVAQVPTAANHTIVVSRGRDLEDPVAYRVSELLAPRHISMVSAKLPRWFPGGGK